MTVANVGAGDFTEIVDKEYAMENYTFGNWVLYPLRRWLVFVLIAFGFMPGLLIPGVHLVVNALAGVAQYFNLVFG